MIEGREVINGGGRLLKLWEAKYEYGGSGGVSF